MRHSVELLRDNNRFVFLCAEILNSDRDVSSFQTVDACDACVFIIELSSVPKVRGRQSNAASYSCPTMVLDDGRAAAID